MRVTEYYGLVRTLNVLCLHPRQILVGICRSVLQSESLCRKECLVHIQILYGVYRCLSVKCVEAFPKASSRYENIEVAVLIQVVRYEEVIGDYGEVLEPGDALCEFPRGSSHVYHYPVPFLYELRSLSSDGCLLISPFHEPLPVGLVKNVHGIGESTAMCPLKKSRVLEISKIVPHRGGRNIIEGTQLANRRLRLSVNEVQYLLFSFLCKYAVLFGHLHPPYRSLILLCMRPLSRRYTSYACL